MPNRVGGYPIHQSPLYRLRSRSKLAKLIDVTLGELRRLCKNSDNLYSEFEVARKNGGTRDVENPTRALKLAQTHVAKLLGRITPPDYLFCPVKGRSYVSNAARHRGQRAIRCLDVRRYFPSTSSKRVFWFFHTVMECEQDIAATLTRLATYKGHLPTGSPLSPIMAYYAHYDVWEAVASICRRHSYTLTVYIDDVTISGSALSAEVLWEIKRAIHKSGLRYHKEKCYLDRPAEITGVVVRGHELRVPNRQLRKLHDIRSAVRLLAGRPEKKLAEKLVGLNGQINQIAAFNRANA